MRFGNAGRLHEPWQADVKTHGRITTSAKKRASSLSRPSSTITERRQVSGLLGFKVLPNQMDENQMENAIFSLGLRI